jgi:hypothetical protein
MTQKKSNSKARQKPTRAHNKVDGQKAEKESARARKKKCKLIPEIEAEIEAERVSKLTSSSSSSSSSSCSPEQLFRIFFKSIVEHSAPTKLDRINWRLWLTEHGCRDAELNTLSDKETYILTRLIWLSEWEKQEHRKQLQRAREFISQHDSDTGYSLPLGNEKWAEIFGVSPNKMREIRRSDQYHFDPVGKRKWRLPKNELPTEYLEKYRRSTVRP